MTEGKKAIFLDIDGTLSWNSLPPCPEDILALRRARDAGHYVFINTGRARGFLPPPLLGVDYLDGYLCGCGTQLLMDGRQLFGDELSRPLLREVVRFFLAHPDRMCLLEAEDALYGVNVTRKSYQTVPVAREDAFEREYARVHVTKLTVLGHGRADAAERALFDGRLETVEQSRSQWYEAILPGNGKGRGMRRACRLLGVPIENSIAIGDSENDLDMFAHAGVAVAMANASPPALEHAHCVTGRCGEGGVAQAVRALVFGEGALKEI